MKKKTLGVSERDRVRVEFLFFCFVKKKKQTHQSIDWIVRWFDANESKYHLNINVVWFSDNNRKFVIAIANDATV